MKSLWQTKTNLFLTVAVFWQFICIGLVSVGYWDATFLWVNIALVASGIILLPVIEALGLFLISLPFFTIFPGGLFNNLPTWRPLLILLIAVVGIKLIYNHRDQLRLDNIKNLFQNYFRSWNYWFWGLGLVALVSLLFARFPEHGLKQIIFVLNAYLIYLIIIFSLQTKDQFNRAIRFLNISVLLTVALGFLQFALTLFAEPYYFWQFWVVTVSSIYYGTPLAEVLAYSNSWFSGNATGSSLRMFGILQDTHSFGMIAVFALALWLSRATINQSKTIMGLLKQQTLGFWIILVLLSFAVIASGTRGIWLALLGVILVSLMIAWFYRAKILLVFSWLSYAVIILLFILSPFISAGLNAIRTFNTSDGFLDRASSIYNLDEQSNVGRLEIWQNSLKFALHHPLGTGYGNFITSIIDAPEAQSYEQLSQQKNTKYNLPQKYITAHSLYLHLLVELGLLGLIVFIAMWRSLAKKMIRYLQQQDFALTANNLFMINIGLALVWLLAYALFDVTILNERVLIYVTVLVALISVLIRNPQLETK